MQQYPVTVTSGTPLSPHEQVKQDILRYSIVSGRHQRIIAIHLVFDPTQGILEEAEQGLKADHVVLGTEKVMTAMGHEGIFCYDSNCILI